MVAWGQQGDNYMLVFRDRSFCNRSDCIHSDSCPDYFNDHLRKCAEKVNLPVSFMFEPDCFKPKKAGDTHANN